MTSKPLFNINGKGLYDSVVDLGDNCIQNFKLARFIVGYTVRKLYLW